MPPLPRSPSPGGHRRVWWWEHSAQSSPALGPVASLCPACWLRCLHPDTHASHLLPALPCPAKAALCQEGTVHHSLQQVTT